MSITRHTLGSIPAPQWHRPFLRYVEGDQGGGDGEPKPEKGGQSDLEKALADAEKWKALSRKNEDQARANADKAKRFDELEEQSKSELEKAITRAEAAEKWKADREAKDAAAEMAADIAKTKGLDAAAAAALRGSTREELEAHAEALVALLPQKPPAPSADGQGEGDPIGDGEMSADDIVKAAIGR